MKILFDAAAYPDPGTSLFWNENGVLETIPALKGIGGNAGRGRLGGGAGAGTDVVRLTCLLNLNKLSTEADKNQEAVTISLRS